MLYLKTSLKYFSPFLFMQLWMPNINMTNIKNILKKKLKLQPALK